MFTSPCLLGVRTVHRVSLSSVDIFEGSTKGIGSGLEVRVDSGRDGVVGIYGSHGRLLGEPPSDGSWSANLFSSLGRGVKTPRVGGLYCGGGESEAVRTIATLPVDIPSLRLW